MKKITFNEKKSVELEILKCVHSFCVDNNIKYYLTFGTLIGAIRHNGFIPWDDDIDIFIPYDDYERFVMTFKSQYYRCYSMEKDKKYPFTYAKVVDTRTTKREPIYLNKKISLGVDIDVFPLNYYYKDNYDKEINKTWNIYCKLWNLSVSTFCRGRLFRDIVLFPARFIFRQFNSTIKKKISKLTKVDSNGNDPIGYITAFCTSEKVRLYDKSWFESSILYKFEDSYFYIPIGYDSLLKSIYGDYMELPPKDKQITHHINNCFYKG